MRRTTIFALASIIAVAVMAFASAGTATAETTLCYVGNCYGNGTILNTNIAFGTEAVITGFGGFGETKCKKSQLDGKIEAATTASGKFSTVEFKECNNTINVKRNGAFAVHHTYETNGEVTVTGFEIEVVAGITCIFSENGFGGFTLKGGSSPVIEVTASLARTGGNLFCPSAGNWHATYTVLEPTTLLVATGV